MVYQEYLVSRATSTEKMGVVAVDEKTPRIVTTALNHLAEAEMSSFMNPVRAKLERGEVTIGSWIQFGHPAITEVMAEAGFDWLAFDCEHGELNSTTFIQAARGIGSRETVPMVRVRQNSVIDIRQALDGGAMGVFVPLINDEHDTKAAIAAAKFPPMGIRGYAFSRANMHGIRFDEYVDLANDQILVFIMIETATAIERIDAILEVQGLDGVFIGPYDLSASLGVPAQPNHPKVRDACARVTEACRKRNRAAGIHLVRPTPESVDSALSAGFNMLALGMDSTFLAESSTRAITLARDGSDCRSDRRSDRRSNRRSDDRCE